jgi:hypothetical protein
VAVVLSFIYIVFGIGLQSHAEHHTTAAPKTTASTTEPNNKTSESNTVVKTYFVIRLATHSFSILVLILLAIDLSFQKSEPKAATDSARVNSVVTAITALGIVTFSSFCIAANTVCIQSAPNTLNESNFCPYLKDPEYYKLEVADYSVNVVYCLLQALLLVKMSGINLERYSGSKRHVCHMLPGVALYLAIVNLTDWGLDSFVEVKFSQETTLFATEIAVMTTSRNYVSGSILDHCGELQPARASKSG